MSSFLSSALYYAHRDAKAQGLDLLSRAELLEVAAALFGYDQYRLMKPVMPRIESLLSAAGAAAILDEEGGRLRAYRLLKANNCPTAPARQFATLVATHLQAALAGKVYKNDGAFLTDHLDPYVTAHFLDALVENPEVARAHQKVRQRCDSVRVQDVDEYESPWSKLDFYRVQVLADIFPGGTHPGGEDGMEYLNSSTVALYRKLDRAVLSTHPEFDAVRAEAIRSHGGRGGDVIR